MAKQSEFGVRVNGQELTGIAKWAALGAFGVVVLFGVVALFVGVVTVLRWML